MTHSCAIHRLTACKKSILDHGTAGFRMPDANGVFRCPEEESEARTHLAARAFAKFGFIRDTRMMSLAGMALVQRRPREEAASGGELLIRHTRRAERRNYDRPPS